MRAARQRNSILYTLVLHLCCESAHVALLYRVLVHEQCAVAANAAGLCYWLVAAPGGASAGCLALFHRNVLVGAQHSTHLVLLPPFAL